MKNNTLNIEYVLGVDFLRKTESVRCTSMRGVKRILAKRNKTNIKAAQFTDNEGYTEKVSLRK